MHIVVEGEAYDKLPTDTCWNTQSVCWSPLCLLDIVPFHSAWSLSAFTDCRYTNMPHWNVSDLIGQKIHFYRSGPRKRFWKRKKKEEKNKHDIVDLGTCSVRRSLFSMYGKSLKCQRVVCFFSTRESLQDCLGGICISRMFHTNKCNFSYTVKDISFFNKS